MPAPENHDPLDALLREPEVYIDDAGFTTRVIASLPRHRSSWLRPLVLSAATLLALALLAWWAPELKDVVNMDSGGISLNLNTSSLTQIGALLAGAGAIIWSFFSIVNAEE